MPGATPPPEAPHGNALQRLQEQFIALLCRFEPNAVLPYLQGSAEYRVEVVLPHCQRHGVLDAQAFLLERAADVEAALAIHVEHLSQALQQLVVRVLAQTTSGTGAAPTLGDLDVAPVLASATGPAAVLYVCACVFLTMMSDFTPLCHCCYEITAMGSLLRCHALLDARSCQVGASSICAACLWCMPQRTENSSGAVHTPQSAGAGRRRACAVVWRPGGRRACASRRAAAAPGRGAGQAHDAAGPGVGVRAGGGVAAAADEPHGGSHSRDGRVWSISPSSVFLEWFIHLYPFVPSFKSNRYVPLKTIGQRILQGYGGAQFGDFRGTLGGLLAAYHYEASILQTAAKLIARDTFQAMDAAYRYVTT